MFVMVDYVMKMTVKKSSKHGEYKLFEYFQFLLFICIIYYLIHLLFLFTRVTYGSMKSILLVRPPRWPGG